MTKLYLIGSLRNTEIPKIGNYFRQNGYEIFDDWYGAGHEADDKWKEYENLRGRPYKEALYGEAAKTIFKFDQEHLDQSDGCILALPAGKSGHLEFGYMASNKPSYVLFPNERFLRKLPEQWLWLTGLYEGEGTFCKNSRHMMLSLSMTDRDVVEKAQRIAGVGKVYGPYKPKAPKGKTYKDVWVWRVFRPEELLYVVSGFWENLGQRRKNQIAKVLIGAGYAEKEIEENSGPHEFRWDVMYQFAKGVAFSNGELLTMLNKEFKQEKIHAVR